jgi:pimeloyl-ACP methyl ester carboxylesterase
MKEKLFHTSCGTIHYWLNAIPAETALVFLPGLTADHRLFEKQIEYFEKKCRVLVWDAPEHAASWPFSPSFDLQDKARWLDGILEQESILSPIIVGQSMGGYVGQMYSELFPEKLKGFISIDSAPLQREYVTSAEIWLLKRTNWVYRPYPWKSLKKSAIKGCAESPYGRDLMKQFIETYSRDEYIDLAVHGYKILAEAIEAPLAYEIDCPAIIICGEQDKAASTRRYNRAWTKNTGIPACWIKDAGHNSNTDKPEDVNVIIKTFIESLRVSK